MNGTEISIHTENHKFNKQELLHFGFIVTQYFETVGNLVDTYNYEDEKKFTFEARTESESRNLIIVINFNEGMIDSDTFFRLHRMLSLFGIKN